MSAMSARDELSQRSGSPIADSASTGAVSPDAVAETTSVSVGASVGDVVKVRHPSWLLESGTDLLVSADELRDAVVVKGMDADSQTYTIVFEDEVEETNVEPGRLVFEPKAPCRPGGGAVAAFRFDVQLARSSPPAGFLQSFMSAVGGSPVLCHLTREERAFAQGILHTAFKQLAMGQVVHSRHLCETCGSPCGDITGHLAEQRTRTGSFHAAWEEELAQPTLEALEFLAAEQILNVSEAIVDCEQQSCALCSLSAQQVFVLQEGQLSALVAVCRLMLPTWDALGRCHKRHEHRLSYAQRGRRPSVVRRRPLVPRLPMHEVQAAKRQCAALSKGPSAGYKFKLDMQNSSSIQPDRYRRRSMPTLHSAPKRSVSPVCHPSLKTTQ